jgi:hypothetical protein
VFVSKKKYIYLNRLNVGWWYFPLSDNYSTTTKWTFELIIYLYVVKKNILYFCIFTKIHLDTKKLVFLIENCCCGYVRVIVVFLLTSTPIYVNLGKDWVIVHIFDYLADLINVLFFAVHTSSVISSFNMTRTSCFY